MTERQLVQKWVKGYRMTDRLWMTVLSDTFGGHKKPCDVIGCYKGKFFAVEFKKDSGKLSMHQCLSASEIARSGGVHIVGVFTSSGLILYARGNAYHADNFLQIIEGTV